MLKGTYMYTYMQGVLGNSLNADVFYMYVIHVDTDLHLHTCILGSKLVVVCAYKPLKHNIDV